MNFITRNVVRNFSFLFNKGFSISNASGFIESLGNWFVEFESSSCFIIILSDHDEVDVRIYPVKPDRKVVVGLKPMIFYLTSGRVFIANYEGNLVWETKKQLAGVSRLLEDYIDQIIPFMGREFQNIKNDYMVAGKRYVDIQVATYRQR